MPDTSGSIDLSGSARSPEEEEALRALQAGEQPSGDEGGKDKVLTAFLVLVDYNFNPKVLAVQDPRLDILLPVTPDLVYGAASVIVKDKAAEEAAMATTEAMAMQAQAMREQMLQQQVAQNLAKPGGRA